VKRWDSIFGAIVIACEGESCKRKLKSGITYFTAAAQLPLHVPVCVYCTHFRPSLSRVWEKSTAATAATTTTTTQQTNSGSNKNL
jgi:hypothetical protein